MSQSERELIRAAVLSVYEAADELEVFSRAFGPRRALACTETLIEKADTLRATLRQIIGEVEEEIVAKRT
jgi:hypothetical protein